MKDYYDYYYYAKPARPRLRKRVTVDVTAVIVGLNKSTVRVGNLVCHLNEQYAMPLNQAREEVAKFVRESRRQPWFIGAQRTSEIFISHWKDDSRNDKKAKRCAVKNENGFWISCIDLDPKKF